MKAVCKENMCAGCTACLSVCKRDAISIVDSLSHYNAVIDTAKCIDCGACYRVCPVNSPAKLKTPISWYQGWAEDAIRVNSSSGGAATAIIKGFLENGGSVCSCVFENGRFCFKIVSDLQGACDFAGSKYVKSDPSGVFSEIRKLLHNEKKVLFIGLPCQVAGLKNYVGDHEKLYTVDLICHGSPSPLLLEKYLKESGVELSNARTVSFRNKDSFGLCVDSKRIAPVSVSDSYTVTFLSAVDYTENCYSCRYATFERVSDITLGDAWGCERSELKKGVSLILCQSQKGNELLESSGLTLDEADIENAKQHNHQLRHPSVKHKGREAFFNTLNKGGSFRRAAFRAMPKDRLKQNIKYVYLKIRKGTQ